MSINKKDTTTCMSAKDLLKKIFNDSRLANTTIAKIGKIGKKIAYEVAVVNNGMYCGNAILTIVNKNGVCNDIARKTQFENKKEALEEVSFLKTIIKKEKS